MKEIKNSEKFSFLYGGENMQSCSPKISKAVNGNKTVTVYDFDDGLRVTNVLTEYEKYGARKIEVTEGLYVPSHR